MHDAPGGGSDPHKFDRYAALCDLIDRRVDELVAIKAEVLQAVSRMEDSRYRTLLIDRYARFMRWELVAQEMHYEFRHITRLHGKALEAFAQTMP